MGNCRRWNVAGLAMLILISFQNCDGFRLQEVELAGTSFSLAEDSGIPDSDGYEIIVVAGQSNAVGYGCGPGQAYLTDQDARIFQLTPDLEVIPASDPLRHQNELANAVGFAMSFARLYAASIPARRRVLIVPVAYSGTSILAWDDRVENLGSLTDSRALWDGLLRRTQSALATGGGQNRLVALLWHQGESDYSFIRNRQSAGHPFMPAIGVYETRLINLMTALRNALGAPDLPVVLGELGRFWSQNSVDPEGLILRDFNRQLHHAASKLAPAAVATSEGLGSSGAEAACSSTGEGRDNAHFSTRSQFEFAKRYFAAYERARSRVPVTPSRADPIGYGYVNAGVPIDTNCATLNPDAARALSTQTIEWLASLQPNGLTLHEQYLVARKNGYTGAFGEGEHAAWLEAHPEKRASFEAEVRAMADTPMEGFGTWRDHHVQQRAAGYRGVFLCGGGICYQEGRCNEYGQRR